jgi:hypothetical protein
MMKARTRKAPARTAKGTASHQDTPTLRYIKYHKAAEGTSVLAICHTLRPTDGFWYRATIGFQSEISPRLPAGVRFEFFIMTLQTAFYGPPTDGEPTLE